MRSMSYPLSETMRGTRLLRWLPALLALVVLLAACSPSDEPAPTTSTMTVDPVIDQLEADIERIHELWWGQTLAFGASFDEGIGYWVDNNYPQMGCTYGDYLASWFPEGPVEGYAVEHVANGPTIMPDDGWAIPGGRLQGQVPDGRIYTMSVKVTTLDPRAAPTEPVNRNLHVTVIGDKAYFFKGCSA